jgi:hypothetical protein
LSERLEKDEDLRAAFQGLGDEAPVEDVDTELIWRAVSGELPADECREVVERVARDPSWALAWRVAHELRSALAEREARPALRLVWSRSFRYGALAAGLIAATAAGLWFRQPAPTPGYREDAAVRIESLVPEQQTLTRQHCILRWTGPPGATYELRATSEDLLHVHSASGLTEREYRIPDEFLAAFPPGAKLLWRVEGRLPDGTILAGTTFVAKLE